jgi:hypothetical protein
MPNEKAFKDFLLSNLSKVRNWRDTLQCRKQIESQRRVDCLITELASLVERNRMLEKAKCNEILSLAEFEDFFQACAASPIDWESLTP